MSKVEKVQHFPVPTDVLTLRQFLGLASYYRRFIKNFAAVSSPLTALTKKGVLFVWTTHCQGAFDKLKNLLCTAPVLAYPQFGPGHTCAVLAQEDEKGQVHPVAYAI